MYEWNLSVQHWYVSVFKFEFRETQFALHWYIYTDTYHWYILVFRETQISSTLIHITDTYHWYFFVKRAPGARFTKKVLVICISVEFISVKRNTDTFCVSRNFLFSIRIRLIRISLNVLVIYIAFHEIFTLIHITDTFYVTFTNLNKYPFSWISDKI